jgi:hypothetical protein
MSSCGETESGCRRLVSRRGLFAQSSKSQTSRAANDGADITATETGKTRMGHGERECHILFARGCDRIPPRVRHRVSWEQLLVCRFDQKNPEPALQPTAGSVLRCLEVAELLIARSDIRDRFTFLCSVNCLVRQVTYERRDEAFRVLPRLPLLRTAEQSWWQCED